MLFISYSHHDKQIAKTLHAHLLSQGYKRHQVFFDDDHRNGIVLGKNWEGEIIRNILGAQALIVLVSPHWYVSKWCFAELTLAKSDRYNRAIIPIVVAPLSPEQWNASGLIEYQQTAYAIGQANTDAEAWREFVESKLLVHYPPDRPLQRRRESHPDWTDRRCIQIDDWQALPDMNSKLTLGEEQCNFLESLKACAKFEAPWHTHVEGDSGTGKTRIVLEALNTQPFRESVLYYDHPSSFFDDPYRREIAKAENQEKAIIVVDDCTNGEQDEIATCLSPVASRIKLFTISHVNDKIAIPKIGTLRLPLLAIADLEAIICSYRNDYANYKIFAKLCDGSARFAHLIGESLSNDSSILVVPNHNNIVQRILAGGNSITSEQARRTLVVARFLSLFHQFGVEPTFQNEIRSIARLIRYFHPNFGLGDILEFVGALRDRRIVQGKKTLYIVPRALQFQLWYQWWQCYGAHFRLKDFQRLPEPLQSYFITVFALVPIDDRSKTVAELLMSDSGFYQTSLMTAESATSRTLLRNAADISPVVGLECVWACFANWNHSEPDTSQFYEGMSEFHGLLARQANSTQNYKPAIRILEAACLSKTNFGDNAKDTLGTCYAVRNDERAIGFPFADFSEHLVQMLRSTDQDERMLALHLCHAAISHSRATSDEAVRYLDSLWAMMSSLARTTRDTTEGNKVVELLSECLFSLFIYPQTCSQRLECLAWLAEAQTLERQPMLKQVRNLWRRSNFSNLEVRRQLKLFYHSLIGSDYKSRLATFVLNPEEPDIYEDAAKNCLSDVDLEIDTLAKQSIENVDAFVASVECLIRSQVNTSGFGQALAKHDTARTCLPFILQKQSELSDSANTLLLAGYLSTIRRIDTVEYAAVLEEMVKKLECPNQLLSVIIQSGSIDEHEIHHISKLLRQEQSSPEVIQLIDGEDLAKVPLDTFYEWIQCCLDRNNLPSLNTAIRLLLRRFGDAKFDPKTVSLASQCVDNDLLLQPPTLESKSTKALSFSWSQLFERVLESDLESALRFANRYWLIVAKQNDSILSAQDRIGDRALEHLLEIAPQAGWDTFFSVLEALPINEGRRLFKWISGRKHYAEFEHAGHWASVPKKRLFEWIDQAAQERVAAVCSHLPPLVHDSGVIQITKEFLQRYWYDHPRCQLKVIYIRPKSWSGKLSEWYRKRRAWIVQAQQTERDTQVQSWLQTQLTSVTSELERNRADEEIDEERLRP